LDIVNEYLDQLLAPHLIDYGIGQKAINLVLADVEIRMRWLRSLEDNVDDKLVAFEVVYEESLNYNPRSAPIEIKSLVNFALRNSMFEELCCDHPSVPEIAKHRYKNILDKDVRQFTSNAIRFFKYKWDMWQLVTGNAIRPFSASFPIASRALKNCACIHGTSQAYDMEVLSIRSPRKDFIFNDAKVETEIQSGFDPRVSKNLNNIMKGISDKRGTFYIPYFKFLSRNIEKIMSVFESLLGANATIVTNNYLLRNGFVAKRSKILPVAHTTLEALSGIANIEGLDAEHRSVLDQIASQIE
jgi:hypothetical protein